MSQSEKDERVVGDARAEKDARVDMGARAEKDRLAEKDVARVDRRVRRSRRAIVAAFDRLIMDEPLERITVSLIAREADVDRKTFYQHFGSVDGLLDAIAEDVVTQLLDEVELAGAGGERELDAFFAALADHLSRDLVLQQRYCEHVPVELLFDHLARPLVRQVVERGLVRGGLAPDELEMLLAFGLGGLFSLYRWWLLSDRAVPLDELCRRAGQLVEHGVAPFVAGAAATNPE